MSLDDLGNIGEFAGAIGVVISLAYLAVQIRQNTRQLLQSTTSARLAAVEAANREFNGIRDQVVRDSEVADLYLRGLRDFGSLEPRDRLRLVCFFRTSSSRTPLYSRCIRFAEWMASPLLGSMPF